MDQVAGVQAAFRDDEFRALILAPHGRDAVLAERTLVRSGLHAHVCADLEDLRAESANGAGAVLVAEEALPRIGPVNWMSFLAREPPWSLLPIVVLVGRGASAHNFSALRVLEHRPNVSFLERPVPKRNLVSALRAAIESRRLQYRFRDVLEELKTANRRKDEFLAILSHELRNPLVPIRTAIYTLKVLGGDAESRRKASLLLSMVERQTDYLVRLVDDLLEVSRITTGKIELKRRGVRLDEVIQQAIEVSDPLIREARHKLSVSLVDEPLVVNGDSVRLTQVIANLLNNSAKYTPPGGCIQVSLTRDREYATVSVADNGIGISEDLLPQVFELFSQSSSDAGARSGLGIGLALVRSLVEMHGGRVDARSGGPNRGSEIIVSLPLADKRPESAEPQLEIPIAPSPRQRVLLVDDDHDVADSFAMLLESLGAEVLVAYSGPEALSRTTDFKPRLVFLDIGMSVMDGYETARRIRSTREGADALLIALSGWGREEDRRRAIDAGFDFHLTKPITQDAVRSILDLVTRNPPR